MFPLYTYVHVKKQEKSTILLENRACAVMFFVNVFALSYFQALCLNSRHITGVGGGAKQGLLETYKVFTDPDVTVSTYSFLNI